MPKVKICGITNLEDAKLAVVLGANALGFIFVENSPRYISERQCKTIIEQLNTQSIAKFGIFQNHKVEDVISLSNNCKLTSIQLHGDEDREYLKKLQEVSQLPIIKAYRLKENENNLFEVINSAKKLERLVEYFMLDGPGKGKNISKKAFLEFQGSLSKPVILAGGLSPENIESIIKEVQPVFIDACSGLEERKGKKSKSLMENFFAKFH